MIGDENVAGFIHGYASWRAIFPAWQCDKRYPRFRWHSRGVAFSSLSGRERLISYS